MALTFDPIFAYDPNNPNTIAKDAAITIFDPADSSKAPIAITDPTGSPLPNPITVDAFGMGPAFQHPTLERVGWTGAGFTNYLTSYEGMKNVATEAKDAAQEAASAATTAVAEVVTTAAVDGAGKLILTKASGATVDAGNVKGAPGVPGPPGQPGSNVLPTDDAIEQAILTGGTKTEAALSATYITHLGPSNGTDDTAKIQAALTAARLAGGGVVRGASGATYLISAPLEVGARTWLDLHSLTLIPNSNSHMVTNYSAMHPVATAADAAVAAGSNVITTALADSAVVGQMVEVAGADGNGTGPLVGYISAINTTTNTVTVLHLDRQTPTTATTTVSNAAIKLFNVDKNIKITGTGIWDRGANGPLGGIGPLGSNVAGHSVFLKHVAYCTVDLERVQGTGGITFVWITSIRHFSVSVHDSNVVRTTVQVVGPIHDGRLPYVQGTCTDDLVNICGHVYAEQTDTCGDVTGMMVDKIVARGVGGSALKINAGAAQRVHDVKVGYLGGDTAVGCFIGEDADRPETAGGTYGVLDFDLVDFRTVNGFPFHLAGPVIDRLQAKVKGVNTSLVYAYKVSAETSIRSMDITLVSTESTVQRPIILNNGTSVGTLTVRGLVRGSTYDGGCVVRVRDTATVDQIIFDGLDFTAAHTNFSLLNLVGTAVVKRATFRDVSAKWLDRTGTSHAVYFQNTPTCSHITFAGGNYEAGNALTNANTAPMDIVFTSGCRTNGQTTLINAYAATDITFDGLDTTILGNYVVFVASSATVNLRGSSLRWTAAAGVVQKTGSEVINVYSAALQVDLSKCAKTAGGLANNTNAALSCGVGPAVCNGTTWKNLHTGLTY
jgi:hypothetical protein